MMRSNMAGDGRITITPELKSELFAYLKRHRPVLQADPVSRAADTPPDPTVEAANKWSMFWSTMMSESR